MSLDLILGGALAAILTIVGAWLKGRSAGAKSERAKQDAAARQTLESRNRTDDEVARMDGDAVRRELGRWVPGDRNR